MPNSKTDSSGYNTVNEDKERDAAGKGGPSSGSGIPDDKHSVSAPFDSDLQAQIAAKGHKGKKTTDSKGK
jgi:hypothetical protein